MVEASDRGNSAIVLLSGGQDSVTCLAWAKARFERVEVVSFDYEQRHWVELDAGERVAQIAGVSRTVVPVNFSQVGSAMNDASVPVALSGGLGGSLPTTFLPGRNAAFLSIACGLAASRGIWDVVTGVCQTDYSGYPDCREAFVRSMQKTMSLALDREVRIHTPLMDLTKAQTVLLMKDLGKLDWLKHSHTCYEGKRPACGKCSACVLRLRGFSEAGIPDLIEYEVVSSKDQPEF